MAAATANISASINHNHNPHENITATSLNDPFNYRTAMKNDTMFLSTVKDNDSKLRKFKQINTNRDYSANLFNLDIAGSSPKKFGVLHNKPDFLLKNDDIERTTSKILHIKLDKPENNLNNSDIALSSPQCVKFKTTRQPFNPLEPKYILPNVEKIEPPVPKFIRDNINIDDIQGSFPKKYYKWDTRRNYFSEDIDGSSPKKQKYRTTKYNNIDYNDVTQDKFKTKRCVNPLDPVYEVKYKNNEHYTHGKIEGSKPQTIYPYNYPIPYNLKIDDISGAQIGTKNRINKFTSPYDLSLNLKDIRGAQAASLKKGMTTNRVTNPLKPDYPYLGGKELEKNNNPYGDTLLKDGTINKKKIDINEGMQKQMQDNSSKNKEESKQGDLDNKNQTYVQGFNDQMYLDEK